MLCTGNICRSPAAEAMLRHRLAKAGVEAHVRSAGLLDDGRPAHPTTAEIMVDLGLDVSHHRSRRLTVATIQSADLVLGMAREHVREAVVLQPAAFPKVYTLKELVRRGEVVGPRGPQEPLADWLARVHAGRSWSDLSGSSQLDDIADPIGLPRPAYEKMVDELHEQLDRLVALLWAPDRERSIP